MSWTLANRLITRERPVCSVMMRGRYDFTVCLRATLKCMKLQQLRYLAAIVENDLNITAAAERLHTSQPGVSKQLKQLEDELGFPIFLRQGRTLTRVTPAGKRVIDRALKILKEVQSIKRLADEQKGDGRGSLAIGTTHTQARYVLPRGDPQVPRALSAGRAASAPGHVRADRRHGRSATASTSRSTPARRSCSATWCCCRAIAGTGASSCRRAIRSRRKRRSRSRRWPSIRSSPTCSVSPARPRCSRSSRAPASRRASRSPHVTRM